MLWTILVILLVLWLLGFHWQCWRWTNSPAARDRADRVHHQSRFRSEELSSLRPRFLLTCSRRGLLKAGFQGIWGLEAAPFAGASLKGLWRQRRSMSTAGSASSEVLRERCLL